MLKNVVAVGLCAALLACEQPQTETAAPSGEAPSLAAIIASLPAEARARVPYRNPAQTLAFFGVEPGMTVVDTIPGDIWYTGILADYLGAGGKVIGADRPLAVWEYFGPEYSPPEFLAKRPNWTQTWPVEQAEKNPDSPVTFDAFAFANAPERLAGSVDVVLMVREFHNLLPADETGDLTQKVLDEVSMILKPGGVFALIDHRAPESASDGWASGENGYVKQSTVVDLVTAAGFTFDGASEVNANAADKPSEEEAVWRLPPTLDVASDEMRAAMTAIGESDRMTLKFRKPL